MAMKQRQIRMGDEDWEWAKQHGGGRLLRGIVRVLRAKGAARFMEAVNASDRSEGKFPEKESLTWME